HGTLSPQNDELATADGPNTRFFRQTPARSRAASPAAGRSLYSVVSRRTTDEKGGTMPRYMLHVPCAVPAPGAFVGDASAQSDCDRQCLRTLLDQYLNAVVANDPSAAPLVVGFRQTENAINVRPGRGVWQTVTGLGEVQRRYFDPVTGQAGYYGTVEEGDATAIVTVRIRVENRELTEAEWYLVRENDPGLSGPRQPGRPPANLHNPQYLAENPPPERVVPP